MSNAAQVSLAKKILEKIDKDKAKILRKTLQRDIEGQILIISVIRFYNILQEIFPELKEDKEARRNIWDDWTTHLRTLETKFLSSVDEKRAEELKEAKATLRIRPQSHKVFIIKNFRQIQYSKGRKLLTIIKKHLPSADEERLGKVAGRDNKFGAQLGHAEGSQGVATSTVSASRAAAMISGSALRDDPTFTSIVTNYDNKLTVTIDHEQIVDSKGNLRKNYIPVITWQKALTNQQQKDLEVAAIQGLRKELQDVVNAKGSKSLKDAIDLVMVYNIATKNTRTKASKAQVVKSRSKGSSSKKIKSRSEVRQINDAGISVKAAKAIKSKEKAGRQLNPMGIVALINQRLPNIVRKNMNPPALQNQTGRLANSVRLIDVLQTRSGFLSFGYNYQKTPYQVFEVGEGAPPWATRERDPRRLIDKSIREAAAELALGRFYTRRL
tara:strand:+ start:45 stop:1364 length:1320 start_codon:yes stop_codon:yes gene_type:complete